jgi:hypothetical protein
MNHAERVRLKGQDRVRPANHLAMTDVNAVERPDRDLARAADGLG